MEESNEEHRVVPELYFLIAKFLSGGPLKETAKTLLKELETVKVLPRRLDWEGNEHAQSYDELASQYSEVSWRRLATVCERALQLARGVTAGDVTDQPSERLAARLSLLSETLVRPRPQYGTHKRDHTLARRLASRERGATSSVQAVFPARLLSGLTLQRRTLGHLSAVYCVVFTWCGRYVVTGADDMLVKVWSAVDGRLITTLRGARAEITDVCVTRDGALVACGSVDRCVRVWALADGEPRGVLAAHAGTITSVHWAPGARADVRWLASTSTDCSVAFWTCSGEGRFLSQPVQYVERMRPGVCHMICAAWSAGGAFLAAGSADHHVRVYSLSGGTPKRVLETAIHTDAVDSLAWAHSGLRLVSGSKDGAAALWTLHATQWRHVLLRPEPLQDDNKRLKMTMVCWDRSDAWVITAVSDRSVRVWCARSARQVRVLLGHKDEAYVLEPHPFLPAVFLSAGHDGQLFVWDATRSEPIARYHNRIEGHGHGAIFDAKWGGGATLAATDSHGHLLLLGLGRGHKLFGQLPTELFFHTDYRPLAVDAAGHAHDEQTDTPPHLLPPPFLVDVEGAPHPPHYQRLVPGRELLALDQLIPAPTHHHQVGDGGEGGARGVWRGEGVRHTAGAWQRGDPLLLPPPSRLVTPLDPSAADHAHQVARELHALEEAWYRREMRRRPLMISTAGGEGSTGPRRRAGRKRRGPGTALAPAAPPRAPSPAPLSPLSERIDSSEEHDSSLELSDTTSTSSHTASRSDSSMSSQYSDWEAGAALAPPARARARRTTQPARYSPSPVQKRPPRAAAPRSGPPSPPSPSRLSPSPPPPPPPELPDVYRPGDWITATTPKKSPYHPQMGDECLYFRLGHQRYFEAVSEKDVYKVNPRDKPWERGHVYECELVKVVGIKYVIKPPRIACLRLACSLGGVSTVGTRQLTVRYHDMPDVIDFLVPRSLYELSVARNWGAGDRFRCIIDDSWWTGLVLDNLAPEPPLSMEDIAEPGRWAAAAAAQFLALRVRWDNGEVERLSAWDLEPVDPQRLPVEPGGAVPVLPRELDEVLQRAAPHDWPHDACRTIARHVGTVMSLAAAEPFVAPVDLSVYPAYARVVPYPVDLACIRARFDARFYRRSAAAQFDVRYIATNAERFNESHSIIVRQARLVSELLLHIISNWQSVDVVSKYHELAAAYRSSDDEPLVTSLKVRVARPWVAVCAGVLRELLASSDAEPFRQPVQPDQAPDYCLVVSEPMDLGTVGTRLNSGQYSDAAQFAQDVRLVFTNSRLYNTNKRSRIYSMTVRLSALFESLWSRCAVRRRSQRKARVLRRTRRTRTHTLHALTNGSSKLDSASSDSETLAVTSRRVHGVPLSYRTGRDSRAHQRDSWDSDEPLHVHSKGKGVGKKSKSSSTSVEPGPSTSRARSRDNELYMPPLELRNGLGSSSSESGGELLVEEQLPDDDVEFTYDTDDQHSSGQSTSRRARRKRRASSGSFRVRGRHKHIKRRSRARAATGSSSCSSSASGGASAARGAHASGASGASDASYRPARDSSDDDAPLTCLRDRAAHAHGRKGGGVSLRARHSERRYNEDSEEDSAAAISKRYHHHAHRAHLNATSGERATRSDHDYVAPPATINTNGNVASGSRGSVGNGLGGSVAVVSVSSRGRVRKLTPKARGLLRD